jgi:hypothetical protein
MHRQGGDQATTKRAAFRYASAFPLIQLLKAAAKQGVI